MSAVPAISPAIAKPLMRQSGMRASSLVVTPSRAGLQTTGALAGGAVLGANVRLRRSRARRRDRVVLAGLAGFYCGVCTVIAGLTCLGVTLVGNVALEQARQQTIAATSRAQASAKELASLRHSVEELGAPALVQQWAHVNGFVDSRTALAASSKRSDGGTPRG